MVLRGIGSIKNLASILWVKYYKCLLNRHNFYFLFLYAITPRGKRCAILHTVVPRGTYLSESRGSNPGVTTVLTTTPVRSSVGMGKFGPFKVATAFMHV
uniref:Uncharacterized protein n=1 Tax=Pararge aegeria TaxID=116150 RepID=S4PRZ4_9NEOP